MEIKSPPHNHLGMCTVQLFNNALYAAPSGPLIFLNVSLRVLSRSALFVRSLISQAVSGKAVSSPPCRKGHLRPSNSVKPAPVLYLISGGHIAL